MNATRLFLISAVTWFLPCHAGDPVLQENRIESVKASLLVPAGWHVREDSEEGVTVTQITREKVSGGNDSFLVGLTLSVTPDVPGRTQTKPSQYAADLLAFSVEDSGGKILTTEAAPFKTLRTEYMVEADAGRMSVVDVATANDTTGTLYFLAWHCPESEVESLAALREKIIASLKFDPSF